MDLPEFLRETQAAVRSQMRDGALYEELVFCGIVMEHMSEIGMTFDPVECHFEGKVGNANLRLSGYAMSEENDQLDLFVSLYSGAEEPTLISDTETKTALGQCLRFLTLCAEGKMAPKLDPSSDVRSLAETLQAIYDDLEQIRVYVITDRVAKSKSFKTKDVGGKAVRLEVMDIERLHRHTSEGKARDELVVDFAEASGAPLPCVFVPGENDDYDYALTAIPAEALRLLYEKFGGRLLEANVRSFLSVKGKGVNAGIQSTLRSAPERFMAYNNGLVIVADEMRLGKSGDGSPGIAWLKGLQIVNGGQTTASIYFAKRKYPETDLSRVRVPAKIIIMRAQDSAKEEALVSDISRFANTQNAVRQSDLSANKPFHVEIEKLSRSVYCPDGVGQWFYERAAGSYNTLLAREGSTPAKLKALKEGDSGRATRHQDRPGQIHHRLGPASRNRQPRLPEELRQVHGRVDPRRRQGGAPAHGGRLQGDDRQGQDLPRRPEAAAADVPGLPGERHRLHGVPGGREARIAHRPRPRLGQAVGLAGAARPNCGVGARGQRCAALVIGREDGLRMGQAARVP